LSDLQQLHENKERSWGTFSFGGIGGSLCFLGTALLFLTGWRRPFSTVENKNKISNRTPNNCHKLNYEK
jgi:hypothetical protein